MAFSRPKSASSSPAKSTALFALVSAVAALTAYGLLLPSSAIFGDDPNFLWAYHRGGAAEFRPFMGWIREYGVLLYEALSPIFRESIPAWRGAALLLRWVSAILFFLTLRRAFPKRTALVFSAGLLFLLYPGFSQQAIPLEFILHFFSLSCILGSIALHQDALDPNRRRISAALRFSLAIALSLVGVFSCEYFIGLELVRLPLVYRSLSDGAARSQRVKRTLFSSIPFLMILTLFFYWRLFATSITYLEPVLIRDLSGDPLGTGLRLVARAAGDLKTAFLDAFALVTAIPLSGRTGWLILGLIFGGGAGLSFLLRRLDGGVKREAGELDEAEVRAERRDVWTLILLGLFAGILSGVPVWGAGLEMTLTLFWDRLTLSFMWGASVFAAAFIGEVFRRRYRTLVWALLIALTLGYQFQLQNRFRRDWEIVRSTLWELKTRAPEIEPETAILIDRMPVASLTDNSLNALVNWLYEDPAAPVREAYKVFEADNRRETLLTADPASSFTHNAFTGRLADAIFAVKTPSGCLTLLRPGDRLMPSLSKEGKALLERVAEPSARILPTVTRSMRTPSWLGDEPGENWCALYERAELAADHGDWDDVLFQAKKADELGLEPVSAAEYRSFFVAALITDDLERAERYAAVILAEEGVPAYVAARLDELTFSPAAEAIAARVRNEAERR